MKCKNCKAKTIWAKGGEWFCGIVDWCRTKDDTTCVIEDMLKQRDKWNKRESKKQFEERIEEEFNYSIFDDEILKTLAEKNADKISEESLASFRKNVIKDVKLNLDFD